MDNKITRYVKLSEAVNYYIDEARLTSKEFRRLWVLAFRGLQEIGMDVSWTPKIELLNINPNKTVDLPDDYLDWVRVGIFNPFGELATLRVNEQLTTYRDNNPNRLSDISSPLGADTNYLQYPAWYGYWDDNGSEHYFGAGSGLVQAGECKIDTKNSLIILDPQFTYNQVVLEYISSPVMDDDYTIDLKVQEALISFIRWKDLQSLPATNRANINEKTIREREYYNQKRMARKRLKPFRLQVSEQFYREAQTLGVKG
jgi:hypothetical protein